MQRLIFALWGGSSVHRKSLWGLLILPLVRPNGAEFSFCKSSDIELLFETPKAMSVKR
ncbi:hypothetical protein [Tenuifilum thalassicum]|uniref:hypothetical protein n=1 Tax=Tenuifilum thalassicum TaxID=2590900 RepID=UPI0015662252|nr:hypothetical protein [Tenuifilum thalassicum]